MLKSRDGKIFERVMWLGTLGGMGGRKEKGERKSVKGYLDEEGKGEINGSVVRGGSGACSKLVSLGSLLAEAFGIV